MTVHDDMRTYLYYLRAELNRVDEFIKDGTWHVDCACEDCRHIREWMELSFWRRLKAKLYL